MENIGFNIENGEYGKRVIVTSQWTNVIQDYIIKNQVKELVLNDAKGWRGDNINFLEKIGNLIEKFIILDDRIKDISPVHFLMNLKHFQNDTLCNTKIDYATFKYLEDCRIDWKNNCESIFEATKLKYLYLGKYLKTDLQSFKKLINLETLILANSVKIESLNGIEKLKKLKNLSLYNLSKLSSIENIKELQNLNSLEIEGCRYIKSLNTIGKIKNLKKLDLSSDGKIESIKFVETLKNLEELYFIEDTNVLDGDMNPISKLKKLNRLSYQNRRHYNLKREEFEAYHSK